MVDEEFFFFLCHYFDILFGGANGAGKCDGVVIEKKIRWEEKLYFSA